MDKTFFNQLGGNCRAKAVNIHGITGCKMNEVAQSLGRAFRVDTAQGGFIFQMNDRCPAGGADLRHLIRLCILCMPDHTDDFWNDIARLTHLNGVANAEAKLFDEILVVQSGAGNGGAGEENRVKTSGGRQHTGAANRHINAAQNRFLDLRWVLECNGPAREFIGGAHQIALCEIVDLDDRAVHIKIELGTILADLFDLRDGILNIMNDVVARRDREAQTLEVIQTFGVGGQLLAANLLNIEDKDGKATAPGDLCVFLAQRTGGCVPRVFERSRTLQLLLCAELLKCFVGHVHLTTHLQKLWSSLQMLRDAADGFDIGRYIFTDNTIATGRSPNQLAVFIFQATGKTINFDLDHIFRGDTGFLDAMVKVAQFVIGKRIQQAFHFDRMGHLGKAPAGCTTHMLRRRSGRDQLRIGSLQLFQLSCQGIVFKIFQLRGILIVIEAVVFFNDRAQLLHTLLCLFQFQHGVFSL